MLSRVADSIYWMARYVERAENMSRLLLSTQHLLLDAGAEGASEESFWGPVLAATGDAGLYESLHGEVKARNVVEFLTASKDNPNSIANNIRAARENARTVRDQISDEVWECLNSLRLWAESPKRRGGGLSHRTDLYERVLRGSYEFQGVAASTTPRGEAWRFLRLGTCLERADQTSRLLDSCSGLSRESPPHPAAQPLRWAALLRSCSAWHAFQSRHSRIEPAQIAGYLLLDMSYPRSVAFCINEVHALLLALAGGDGESMHETVRCAGRLRADLAYAEIGKILDGGLHEFLDALQARMIEIGDAIFRAFVFYADLTPVKVGAMSPDVSSGGDGALAQEQ